MITIALLTYAAYFMLRGAIEDADRRARFAAVYVIVAFVTIIMAYISVRILRDIHPRCGGRCGRVGTGRGRGAARVFWFRFRQDGHHSHD
ncbi:MAG: cytochrome c biogenesis protein [Chloroflexi bacterium]|nr:cytochrome c biogenesis protein [Chloroflexota bacterium]